MFVRQDMGVESRTVLNQFAKTNKNLKAPTGKTRIYFGEDKNSSEKSQAEPKEDPNSALQKTANNKNEKISKEEFFKELELLKSVSPELKTEVLNKTYKDLGLVYGNFWKNVLAKSVVATDKALNIPLRAPIYLLKGVASTMNKLVPSTKKLVSVDDAEWFLNEALKHDVKTNKELVKAVDKVNKPQAMEAAIDDTPVIKQIQLALKIFGNNGEITEEECEKLLEKIISHVDKSDSELPEDSKLFKNREEFEAAINLVTVFPFLVKLSDNPGKMNLKTVENFSTQVKDSIPFLYSQCKQNADNYVTANLLYLGASDALQSAQMAETTTKVLNDFKTTMDNLQNSKNSKINLLGKSLEPYYKKLSEGVSFDALLKNSSKEDKIRELFEIVSKDYAFDPDLYKNDFLRRSFMGDSNKTTFTYNENRALRETLLLFCNSADTAEEREALNGLLNNIEKVQKHLKGGANAFTPNFKEGFFESQWQKITGNNAYQKVTEFANDKQVSDMQFMPFFSFISSLYAQVSGKYTGLMQDVSIMKILEQMATLEFASNIADFGVSLLQIRLTEMEEGKAERYRAKYERDIKLFQKENELLKQKIKNETEKLMEAINKDPSKKEKLEEEFKKTVFEPLNSKMAALQQNIDHFQLKVDKLLGIKPMSFLEKMWKKPPKLLNDIKIILPLSLATMLPYDLYFYNRYTDYPFDPISWRFFNYIAATTALSIASRVTAKQIIHLTQDKTKLYQLGKKDEMISDTTREFLANLKGTVDVLLNSENKKIHNFGQSLQESYIKISTPLIGKELKDADTEKAKNREAKLTFSMDKTDYVKNQIIELEAQLAISAKEPVYSLSKQLLKLMKSLQKIYDKSAYIPIIETRKYLEKFAERYQKTFEETGSDKHLPEKFVKLFKDDITNSLNFLSSLEKKYPKAENNHEPLLLKAKEDGKKLHELFKAELKDYSFDADIYKWDFMKRSFFAGSSDRPFDFVSGRSLKDNIRIFSDSVGTAEEEAALNMAIKSIKRVKKGLKRDIHILTAPSKEESLKALAAYKNERQAYSEETSKMPFGVEKVKREVEQTGMLIKQGYKNVIEAEKYDNRVSGIFWVPSHSLLNVLGRLTQLGIVQGQLLPAKMMLMLWMFGQLPIRFYSFGQQKFMVLLDSQRRDRLDAEKNMKDGMGSYIEKAIAEKTAQIEKIQASKESKEPAA